MSRKGQGISINTIIIAAIALAVLVVLFAIFTGRLGSFSKGVAETANCQNSCSSLGLTKFGDSSSKEVCEGSRSSPTGLTYIAGTYSDVAPGLGCCCSKP